MQQNEGEKSPHNAKARSIENAQPFPSFEELVQLAKESPLEFESLRLKLCSQLIDSAPEHYQHRLQGLQFIIDNERKLHGSSYKTCLKISNMMNESLSELSQAISNPEEFVRKKQSQNCEVIPLFS